MGAGASASAVKEGIKSASEADLKEVLSGLDAAARAKLAAALGAAAKAAAAPAAPEAAAAPKARKVALISTSASDFDGHATGLWLEELACPYYLFLEAGLEVDIVSIAGGEPPVDAGSRAEGFYTEEAKKFDADEAAQAKFKASKKLEDVAPDVTSYAALYLAGGHGTCVDFPNNQVLIDCIEKMYAAGRVIAADCHGPIALIKCKRPDGEPLVKGLAVTGFSNSEESAVSLLDKCKGKDLVLEDNFVKLGGAYEKGDDWNSKVCVAGTLVTGQNPQSSAECAKKVLELLK